MSGFWQRLAGLVTGRWSAWVVLAVGLASAAAVSGVLGGASPPDGVQTLPDGSESAKVQQLQKRFPHHKLAPVTAVVTRDDGGHLSKADLDAADTVGKRLGEKVDRKVSSPITSKDHQAAVVNVQIDADRPNSKTAPTVDKLRSAAHDAAPSDLTVQITGGPHRAGAGLSPTDQHRAH